VDNKIKSEQTVFFILITLDFASKKACDNRGIIVSNRHVGDYYMLLDFIIDTFVLDGVPFEKKVIGRVSQYSITHGEFHIQIELEEIVIPGDTRTKVIVVDGAGIESKKELLVDREVELLPVIQSMLG
jgi:hypothetical protein